MVTSNDSHNPNLSQIERFKQAAREHGADEDAAHWDQRLKKIAKAKPTPEKGD